MGWVAPRYVKSSWTRDQTHASCIGRQILNLWTTRDVPVAFYTNLKDIYPDSVEIAIDILKGIASDRWRWKCQLLSPVWLFEIPQSVAHQAPLSREFSRQGYWVGLPFSSPRYLPDPGMEPRPRALQTDSSPSEPQENRHIETCSASLIMWESLNRVQLSVTPGLYTMGYTVHGILQARILEYSG